jgi:hypothetical protein
MPHTRPGASCAGVGSLRGLVTVVVLERVTPDPSAPPTVASEATNQDNVKYSSARSGFRVTEANTWSLRMNSAHTQLMTIKPT